MAKAIVMLDMNDEVVQGNIVEVRESYNCYDDFGREVGYSIMVIEADSIEDVITANSQGKQYRPAQIEIDEDTGEMYINCWEPI